MMLMVLYGIVLRHTAVMVVQPLNGAAVAGIAIRYEHSMHAVAMYGHTHTCKHTWSLFTYVYMYVYVMCIGRQGCQGKLG
jgi:hypothetical protein